MLENALQSFTNNVFSYLTKEGKPNKGLLIKKHSQNLQTQGDFSFPSCLKSWHQYIDSKDLNKNTKTTIMQHIGKESNDLIDKSINWILQIKTVKEEKGHIHLFLERPNCIRVGLLQASSNTATISNKTYDVTGLSSSKEGNDLTSLRLKYLSKAIQNLYNLNVVCQESKTKIVVMKKVARNSTNNAKVVWCGDVLSSKTGACDLSITDEDFIRNRQNEMTLIAQHKYGVRVSTDAKWKDFIAHLGESSVIFELLQTKPGNDVKVNFECSSAGSSKGASFVLYNCARLETLVRTFMEKVENGTYPPLPDISDIDYTLLTHEDEWCLIFNYILGLSYLIDHCSEVTETSCEFRPHHICSFLLSMSKTFSQYYRKVRILTEPRKHLLPVLFARMHMVIVLNKTLQACLKILNIKGVTQM